MADYSKMSDEELKVLSGESPTDYAKMSDKELEDLAGGGSMKKSGSGDAMLFGAAGLGAGALGAKIISPWVKKSILKNTEINPFRKQFEINKSISPHDYADNIQLKIDRELVNANKTVVKNVVSDVVKNAPEWRNTTFKNYETRLNQLNDSLHSTGVGVPMEAGSFRDNVIQRTADVLRLKGLDKEALVLERYSLRFKDGDPIQFSQVKQAIANLGKKNPIIRRPLTENFGEYLANDPIVSKTSVGKDFKQLQAEYTKFKPADNLLETLVKIKKFGNLNTAKITAELNKYLIGKGNPQTTEFLRQLGQDSSLTKGMPNVTKHANKLDVVLRKVQILSEGQRTAMELSQKLSGLEGVTKSRSKMIIGASKGVAGLTGLRELSRIGGAIAPFAIQSAPELINMAIDKEYRKKMKEKISEGKMQQILDEMQGKDLVL